jgi:hypothetical protein
MFYLQEPMPRTALAKSLLHFKGTSVADNGWAVGAFVYWEQLTVAG